MIQNLAATVGFEPTSCRLTSGHSAVELHSKYVWGRRYRAQPGLNAAAFPLKDSAPTSTQSTLLKSNSGASPLSHIPVLRGIRPSLAKKNPGWFEPAGVSHLELPWKVRCSSLPETI